MHKATEINLSGDWTCEWQMEQGEFLVTARESGYEEDHWAETIRMSEMNGEKAFLSIGLPDGIIVNTVDILFGSIVVFAQEELPCS